MTTSPGLLAVLIAAISCGGPQQPAAPPPPPEPTEPVATRAPPPPPAQTPRAPALPAQDPVATPPKVAATPPAPIKADASVRGGAFGNGVLLGPAGRTVYMMAPHMELQRATGPRRAHVVAFDARTGKRRWINKSATKPLVVVGKRLLAAGVKNHGIAVLSARTGNLVATCKKGPKVIVPIFNGLGSHHSSHAFVVDGVPVVVASTRTHYAGGMAPSPEMERRARSHTVTVFSVDMKTGCPTMLAQAPEVQLPWFGSDGSLVPIRIGNLEFSVSSKMVGAQRQLTLRRSRAGRDLQDVRLATSNLTPTLLSADYRHILTLEYNPKHVQQRYLWTLVEVASGNSTSFYRAHSPSTFIVAGNVVLANSGGVTAVSMAGKTLWTKAVANTAYMGPRPPSRAR